MRTVGRIVVALGLSIIALASCGDDKPPPADPGGSPGSSTSAPASDSGEGTVTGSDADVPVDAAVDVANKTDGGDAGDGGLDTDPCGLGPADLTAYGADKKNGVVRGTITLPSPRAVSRVTVHYRLFSPSYTTIGLQAWANISTVKSQISYQFIGVDPAYPIYIFARLEENLDLAFDDGDWAGFYAGSTSSPAPPWSPAVKEISLKTNPKACNIDFGIGPIVCHRAIGESCTVKEECRSTICRCKNGLGESTQSCNETSGKCESIPIDCAAKCAGSGGVAKEGIGGCTNVLP